MNQLFGNPIGLASTIVIFTTFLIVVVLFTLFIMKSGDDSGT
jgi:hypothetical protein